MTGPQDKISGRTFELEGVGSLGSPEVANPRADNANKEGSLLDSALFNLNIAHQYVDESKHLPEHRLVCFHYAVALLARHLSPYNAVMIGRARRYLLQAANWGFTPDENAKNQDQLRDSHRRIVCEALYNVGVIDESGGNDGSAKKYYGRARSEATKNKSARIVGVEILATFGLISLMRKELLRNQPKSYGIRRKQGEILNKIAGLRDRIEEVKLASEGSSPRVATKAQQPVEAVKGTWLSRIFSLFGKELEEESSPSREDLPDDQTLKRIDDKLNDIRKEALSLQSLSYDGEGLS